MIIGITGGTGSGKTTLLDLIRRKGGLVLDCDAVYHRLLQTDTDLLQTIETRFPGTVEDGALDRKRLGTIVFSDDAALADLNKITHAAVKAAVEKALYPKPELAAIDAIGLFEGELDRLCDVTVAVTAPEEQRIARLMAREGITAEYASLRISAQHSDDWFREQCDYTLENDTTVEAFESKCIAFFQRIGIL